MKILIVNDYSMTVGGAEIYIGELKKQLENKSHKVKIFTGSTIYRKQPQSKSVIKLISLLFSIKCLYRFHEFLRQFKPDIIHINNIFYELSPSFLLLTKNTPVLMTVHDNQLYSPVSIKPLQKDKSCKKEICAGCNNCMGIIKSKLETMKRNLHKLLLRNVDLYVGNSQYINSIINRLKIGHTANIKFGINLFPYSPLNENNNMLYVGRIVKEKGIQYLIEAMPDILYKFPQLKLTIVGDGDYKEELKEKVKLMGLGESILFKNKIKRINMHKYYKNSVLVLIPSIWNEPFSLVGIEAMSVGRPVIASNVGGIPEWLKNGKTGYLIKPRNVNQISENVIRLLSDKKLLKQMSLNARKQAEEYSIEKHVNELEKMYKELVIKYKSGVNVNNYF